MKQARRRPCASSETSVIETEILRLARERPELGQAGVAKTLRGRNLEVSPSGVRYILQRHGLETTFKRLQALAEQSSDGIEALTEQQRQYLARGALTQSLSRPSPSQPQDGESDEPIDRRQIVLNAAAQLFSEKGYEGTSIRDIAARAGLLPGSVYHYYASKEELFIEVHREGIAQVKARIESAIAQSADPWERLRIACEVHFAGILEGAPIDRIAGRNLALTGKVDLLKRTTPYRNDYENVFRDLIDALPAAPGTDRSLLRLFLLGGMNWACLWYRPGGIRSPEEIARVMFDMVRHGVQE
ncbi:transcriptional regulator, TetR family [Thiorhodococcus drewsii AZ1]|uniref:Transcriptional regulator, TetR family n=1 Tax=Thiorhodococcus drewsii AZ1 TaxID=765913 RepID=G2E4R6_9GAMM|nr:TetR/AcrR family transcriptional regulator [Thiorhodococcus drewsii]EGV29542.1 transcriptional regulator, TetR family [Thiorhodococcus drewsii AZ1]